MSTVSSQTQSGAPLSPSAPGARLVSLAPAGAVKKPVSRKPVAPLYGWRLATQACFLVLNLWIGWQFYLWVRYYETLGSTRWVHRPAGVEGWLPIASLMNLKVFLLTGDLPSIHPAGMVLLMAFLTISLLLRRSFCSWLCPVGAVSEWLWRLGKRIFGRAFFLPNWLDYPLRSLKYILLALFLWVIVSMPAAAIRAFLTSPYGIIADVKMLDFFRFFSTTTAIVLTLLVSVSLLVPNFWCRFLCPYGALHGLVALISPARVRRDGNVCIDCSHCARACPSRLPVNRLPSVRSPECTGCLDCVAACPAAGALTISLPASRSLSVRCFALGVAAIFLLFVGVAKFSHHWDTHLPEEVYQRLVPLAREFSHP